jgi:hypothetical protein
MAAFWNRERLVGIGVGAALAIGVQWLFSALGGWAVFHVPGSIQYDVPKSSVRIKRLEDKPSVLILERGNEVATIERKGEVVDGHLTVAGNAPIVAFVLKSLKLGTRRVVVARVPDATARLESLDLKEVLAEGNVKRLVGNEKSYPAKVMGISDTGDRLLIGIGEVKRPGASSSEQLVVTPYFYSPLDGRLEMVTP